MCDKRKVNTGIAKVKDCFSYERVARYRLLRRAFGDFSDADIREALKIEAENYVRKIHRVPETVKCYTYKTDDGRIAVLTLDTPKKRKLWKDANHWAAPDELIENFRHKYGFIPRPVNVLRHYIDIGAVKSEQVEHIYHKEPVDWEITDDLNLFQAAYKIDFYEKDIVAQGFNGYSCMSECPGVGTFYYYFGAYMLIFYKKGTKDIVGRMVLWKAEDSDILYYYKGYVKTRYQTAALEAVKELEKSGKLELGIPEIYTTTLQRMPGKTPQEIFDKICYDAIVPYIDEDLYLSDDKMTLSNTEGKYECKQTSEYNLARYGTLICEECGREIDQDEEIERDGEIYCDSCANYCDCCDEWFAPDADGEEVEGHWKCRNCIEENYILCEQCEEYIPKDEICDYMDKDGYKYDCCEDCLEAYCTCCDDCGEWYLTKDEDEEHKGLCPLCREKSEPDK